MQGGGARPLGPRKDVAGSPLVEGETQSQSRQLGSMAGGVGPQLGRAEQRAVFVEHRKPAEQGPLRPRPIAGDEAEQRGGVPRRDPKVGRTAVAGVAGGGERGLGDVETAERDRHATDEGVHVQGLDAPSVIGELSSDGRRLPDQSPGRPSTVLDGDDVGLDRHVVGQCDPRRATGALERACGLDGLRRRRPELAGGEVGACEEQPGLRNGEHVSRPDGHRYRLGRRVGRFADQTAGEEQLAAIGTERRCDRFDVADRLVVAGGGVVEPQRLRKVAAPGFEERAVVQRTGDQKALAEPLGQLAGFAQVDLGAGQMAEHHEQGATVVQQPGEPEFVALVLVVRVLGVAQRLLRPVELAEGVLEPAESGEQQPALGDRARLGDARERALGQRELAQRAAGSPGGHQTHRQAHADLRGVVGEPVGAGESSGLGQCVSRIARRVLLELGAPQRPEGDDPRFGLRSRATQDGEGAPFGVARVALHEIECRGRLPEGQRHRLRHGTGSHDDPVYLAGFTPLVLADNVVKRGNET